MNSTMDVGYREFLLSRAVQPSCNIPTEKLNLKKTKNNEGQVFPTV